MSTHSQQTSGIGFRKEKHLSICADASRFSVEGGSADFGGIHFIHDALPEIAAEQIDLQTEFLGHTVAAPIFISCMTGGSDRGFFANRELAEAARIKRYAVGMGSIRILFDHPELFEHFHLKALAPDVPIMANIGGVQIRDQDQTELFELVKKLEVDGLVVHLNPGQELFQPEGDRDFRGIKDAIARLCEKSPVPIIVKETGFGIRPAIVSQLLAGGVRYVDVAGAGGTNWVTVEAYRVPEAERGEAREFADWGIPTALLLACLKEHGGKVLASGGVRTGLDVAKSIALGAKAAGLALPLIREVVTGGAEAVVRYLDHLENSLRSVLILTGSRTPADLHTGKIWLDPAFTAKVTAFRAAEGATGEPDSN
ncbi:MAG: type 2 isopentenyl-diphosphate Delta-isomerase [Spirochaetaceae bacterium]|nr:MAG: type 2 isopentenyl-diphosphate Delta-isomerase [Spirochaetaceae bacterium]